MGVRCEEFLYSLHARESATKKGLFLRGSWVPSLPPPPDGDATRLSDSLAGTRWLFLNHLDAREQKKECLGTVAQETPPYPPLGVRDDAWLPLSQNYLLLTAPTLMDNPVIDWSKQPVEFWSNRTYFVCAYYNH
jgi:hypothetical protein